MSNKNTPFVDHHLYWLKSLENKSLTNQLSFNISTQNFKTARLIYKNLGTIINSSPISPPLMLFYFEVNAGS